VKDASGKNARSFSCLVRRHACPSQPREVARGGFQLSTLLSREYLCASRSRIQWLGKDHPMITPPKSNPVLTPPRFNSIPPKKRSIRHQRTHHMCHHMRIPDTSRPSSSSMSSNKNHLLKAAAAAAVKRKIHTRFRSANTFVNHCLAHQTARARDCKHLCKASSQRLESAYGFSSRTASRADAELQRGPDLLDFLSGAPR
jgi:hypothetical protein